MKATQPAEISCGFYRTWGGALLGAQEPFGWLSRLGVRRCHSPVPGLQPDVLRGRSQFPVSVPRVILCQSRVPTWLSPVIGNQSPLPVALPRVVLRQSPLTAPTTPVALAFARLVQSPSFVPASTKPVPACAVNIEPRTAHVEL